MKGKNFFMLLFGMMLFLCVFSNAYGQESSSESQKHLLVEKKIPINLILVGDNWNDDEISKIKEKIPQKYDPIYVSSKSKIGIRYVYEYNFISIDPKITENLIKTINENSISSEIFDDNTFSQPIWQAKWIYDNHPDWVKPNTQGKRDYTKEFHLVNAESVEKFLYENVVTKNPSLSTSKSNLIFIKIDQKKIPYLYDYFVKNSDKSTGKKQEMVGMMGYGGNYNLYFFDLYSAPWNTYDFDNKKWIIPSSMKSLLDCDTEECFTDLVSHHALNAIVHIVTPSLLYPVNYHERYLLDVVVYIKPGGSVTITPQTIADFVDKDTIISQLKSLYPNSDWQIQMSIERRDTRGLNYSFKQALDSTKHITMKDPFGNELAVEIYDSNSLQPHLISWANSRINPTVKDDIHHIPILVVIDSSDRDVFVDQFGGIGVAPPSLDDPNLACCVFAVTDQKKLWTEKIGISDLILHEVGHYLGLNHPFLSWNSNGVMYQNSYFNWYSSPMTYAGPPNGCGIVYYLIKRDSCGIASASFTDFEKERVSDALQYSFFNKTYVQLTKFKTDNPSTYLQNNDYRNIAKTLDSKIKQFSSSNSKNDISELINIYEQSISIESEQLDINSNTNADVLIQKPTVPSWIKNNAKWWAENKLDDQSFILGIQYLIKQEILKVSATNLTSSDSNSVPSWIKNNAKWWSQGIISDDEFLRGIQYLIEHGFISLEY